MAQARLKCHLSNTAMDKLRRVLKEKFFVSAASEKKYCEELLSTMSPIQKSTKDVDKHALVHYYN